MRAFMKTIAAAAAIGALAIAAPAAFGQAAKYPEKPITIVVPFGPGTVDTMTRMIGEALRSKLGQPVIVDNKTGAFGNVGWMHLARQPPDGYTIGMLSNSVTLNPYLYKMDLDPLKDFAPIVRATDFYYVLMGNKNLPVNNAREFFEYAKSQKKPLHFGLLSTTSQVSLAELMETSGVKFEGVPYKSGADLVRAVISGEVPAMFTIVAEAVGHANSLKLIGVASLQRVPQLPNVPTIAEVYPGFRQMSTLGYGAPGGTPRRYVELLNEEISNAVNSEAIKPRLEKMALEVVPRHSPDDFAKFLAAEYERHGKVVKKYKLMGD